MKVVMELQIHNEKDQQKAMKRVCAPPGIDSISVDWKSKKMTINGRFDPVLVVNKLRKRHPTELISVEPPKNPEPIQEKPRKPTEGDHCRGHYYYYPAPLYCYTPEEYHSPCVIC
ncbi:heavy metal-associated isoprenylated plant protein 39 isoform X2 [Hevea brasiliensis]|uniref:heavy metal-associated isoprenylated plant protein 39 isoform X2 n=1 Tax=Hevea brasiliensis TaxID=3981 RepID=UPI0025F58AF0|nr:heavy metal-associated isoprenylated plant protein 39 isoform X2 [Hevea brasiliensis]